MRREEVSGLKRFRNGSNRWLTKLAAMLFAVEAALAAFAVGAGAAPPVLDQFGNVLCSSAGHADAARPHGKGHADKPECCRVGCSVGGERLAPPPSLSSTCIRRDASLAMTFGAPEREWPCRPMAEKKARAPPVAV